MGGEIEFSPRGDVTSTRTGCSSIMVNGATRDVPVFINMGMPLFSKDGKGHVGAVRSGLTSWNYQTPVRLGDVTIAPGD